MIHSSKRALAAALAVTFLAVLPGAASAGRDYEEKDSEALSVAATFVRPVGQVLEWIIFRPLHAISHALDPEDGINDRPVRSCRSLRPRRDCSSQ